MPAKKKPQKVPEVWLILCDGLRVDSALTEAKAKPKINTYYKIYPPYMAFTAERVGLRRKKQKESRNLCQDYDSQTHKAHQYIKSNVLHIPLKVKGVVRFE